MRRMLFKSLLHGPLTEAAPAADDAALAELSARVKEAARLRLGRTLSIREVDAGSCNGCELEIHALNNIVYDLERFGMRFVASPRHADVLLVTGPVTTNMREALERNVAAVREVARRAEALGFRDLWVTENAVDHVYSFDPAVVLTYAAALTTKIRLGVAVSVLPVRNPIHVAHQVATLDYVSNGRAILGVGLGLIMGRSRIAEAARRSGDELIVTETPKAGWSSPGASRPGSSGQEN